MKLVDLRDRLTRGQLNPGLRPERPTVTKKSFAKVLDERGDGPRSPTKPGSRVIEKLFKDHERNLYVCFLDTREFNLESAATAHDIERYNAHRGEPVKLHNVRVEKHNLVADPIESKHFTEHCMVTGWAVIDNDTDFIVAWNVMDKDYWINMEPGMNISLDFR